MKLNFRYSFGIIFLLIQCASNPISETLESWQEIQVPGHWELQGWSVPIYLDEEYPFKPDPPFVPHKYNSVGSYVQNFSLNEDWLERDIFIRFNGVRSAFYFWLNGNFVGYSQGSKTPAEFDITKYVIRGSNRIAVQVYRFSDGSYLEGQDTWRVSGLERDVYLYSQPKVRIADFFVNANLDDRYRNGILDLDISLLNKERFTGKYQVKVRLKRGRRSTRRSMRSRRKRQPTRFRTRSIDCISRSAAQGSTRRPARIGRTIWLTCRQIASSSGR